MAIEHTIQVTYSGGGATPLQANVSNEADNSLGISEECAANSTTTVSLPIVFDPDLKIQSMAAMVVGGDATLMWDAASGSDVTVALTEDVPFIRDVQTFGLADIPTSADTYTLKVVTGADSVTIDGRLLFND